MHRTEVYLCILFYCCRLQVSTLYFRGSSSRFLVLFFFIVSLFDIVSCHYNFIWCLGRAIFRDCNIPEIPIFILYIDKITQNTKKNVTASINVYTEERISIAWFTYSRNQNTLFFSKKQSNKNPTYALAPFSDT